MNLPFGLNGKVILITGASSGIGRECAVSFVKLGASLILLGRDRTKLEDTLSLIEGCRNVCIIADLSNYDELELKIAQSVDKLGPISGFVHCAGYELTKPFAMTKSIDYAQIYNVNVIAGLELAKIISKKKYLAEAGSSFVFISSVVAFKGQIALTAYAATKGALISAVKSMAVELAPKRIRVNTISPGWVSGTGMTKIHESSEDSIKFDSYPLGYGQPEDVANACVYFLADASKWVTGTNLVVDGGYSAK